MTYAQKNAAEEKKEAEKIKNAEQAFAKAKNEFTAASKKFTAAAKEWKAAELRVVKDKANIDRARAAAEEKLEDSTGLPKAIRDYEAAKSRLRKNILAVAYFHSANTSVSSRQSQSRGSPRSQRTPT